MGQISMEIMRLPGSLLSGNQHGRDIGLCCANGMEDSLCESSVVAGMHEQTEALRLPHHELA